MNYEPKKFDHLLGLDGISDRTLANHFALYEGYVNNTNKELVKIFDLLEQGADQTTEFSEVSRRFGWEFNGMRLHEIYFGSLIKGGKKLDENGELAKQLTRDFGSFENWEKQFRAMGAMRGIGWVALYWDNIGGRLMNVWINEHDQGHLSGCIPILLMDVFEHAFMIDYDTKRPSYIEAFMQAINWEEVGKRFDEAS